ncbi:acyl-CoA dehydrogenase family protein [Wenjunlia tyrosinilytica]|uniref:Acyl-CoA dehydrogenase n=1 Tax=Wenjunlia tyrosinilytica TaxID=1544741 RepID=A0A917ZNB7_9ACTN|nr:acyl-CoA dehydrogenase family protein [Wenjunlia tyrosinilytica]GGO86741.1 acyl-CoA dehydrogenase [Wenjunlia tyrosinilytica]
MDLAYSASERRFRDEIRAWLAAHVPPEPLPSMDTAEGFARHREWERGLHEAGWAVVSWPEEYGGRGASLTEWLIFEEEYHRADAPARVTQNGIFLFAPTVFEYGTPEQRRRVLPPMASGEQVWVQGWSEPEAGSDLAALRSRAERADGGWLLSGQKTWSTRAAFGDRMFGLFRTDPRARRHHGLTYFMVDLAAPGMTVRPIRQLGGGTGFAEVFLDEVFVPDEDVVGAVGQGWAVAMSTTGSERGLSLRSPGRFLAAADRLLGLYQGVCEGTVPGGGRPHDHRDAVVDAWMRAEAYRLYTFRAVTGLEDGGTTGAESSLNKVFWSELDLDLHTTALRLLGPHAHLPGPWLDGYVFALAGPIYAGTNEIQRNVIAERLLGLPREPRP